MNGDEGEEEEEGGEMGKAASRALWVIEVAPTGNSNISL